MSAEEEGKQVPPEELGGQPSAEMNAAELQMLAVQDLLIKMQSQFETMSVGILGRIDNMSKKIEGLEEHVHHLSEEVDAMQARNNTNNNETPNENDNDNGNNENGDDNKDNDNKDNENEKETETKQDSSS
eukprot:CAMPEP_0201524310 /NCGR_PEP_ID=MMETSP0161_2-20130828/21242_1 /ASSEMBLY_ACC=CAM_ASM_000251 /TAXON_ID=180227 /ORGANISM="Neoparamoeba aestuarina, Strain SoJaBio B1-5/56/2" /LENGTH=129 /DNA_ID=CAMNT_0047923633 /DNA_START=131 /DNA_END=520 /DNA_ORIENTATION=+